MKFGIKVWGRVLQHPLDLGIFFLPKHKQVYQPSVSHHFNRSRESSPHLPSCGSSSLSAFSFFSWSKYRCMYVCMYVCMHACMDGWMDVCMHACMYACMYVCMHACMHVCMYACMHACMHVCMHACMHACMYVCMYVCRYVYIYILHIFTVQMCQNTSPKHPAIKTAVTATCHWFVIQVKVLNQVLPLGKEH